MRDFTDNFLTFDTDFWFVSDFAIPADWNQTAWDADYITAGPGTVTLEFDGADTSGKPFTGSEIQSDQFYSYGTFEVEMQASGTPGVVSSFFLYSNTFFGADKHVEIDFEFLGGQTEFVQVNYYYANEKLGSNGSVSVPLGFDASTGVHTYTIDWQPDSIQWLADGNLIYEITSETGSIPIPDEPMKIFASIWTGGENLENWHGPVADDAVASAQYNQISYSRYEPVAPLSSGDTVSFAGETDAYIINLADSSFARAAKIMPIGDSLTVGIVDVNDPNEIPEEREGYRLDLFENVLDGDGWIDYVGGMQNGPSTLLDTDHAALSGEALSKIVANNDTSPADLSANLETYEPDIVLFMAGTNDFNANKFFDNRFPKIIRNTEKAIDQFFEYAGNDEKYLVISTIAPKLIDNIPEEFAYYLSEGYTTLPNGDLEIGDTGNGVYTGGIADLVTSKQEQYPTLLLYRNPLRAEDLSSDNVHFTDEGYAEYAQGLYDLLQAEIGQNGGSFATFGGTVSPLAVNVTGGEAGDRIIGNAADNALNGAGGSDHIEGGAGKDSLVGGLGADIFYYDVDALDGTRDNILDFNILEGDKLDLSAIAAANGLTGAELFGLLSFVDASAGLKIRINLPNGSPEFALLSGVTSAEFLGSDSLILEAGPPPDTGDDDGNLALTAPDLQIDASEVAAVVLSVAGIDADATAVVTVSDGSGSVTGNLSADGNVTLDLTSLNDGALTTSVTATDINGNEATVAGPDLTLDTDTTPDPVQTVITGTPGNDRLEDGPGNTHILGLAGKDNITGGAGDDTIEGGAGKDSLVGGLGADIFYYDVDALDGTRDNIFDFNILEGDKLDLSAIAAANGLTGAELFGLLSFVDASAGLKIRINLPNGSPEFALLSGVTSAEFLGSDSLILEAGPPPDTGDDDGNLALTAPDLQIDASEVAAVVLSVAGIDADATAVVTVSDGSGSVTGNLSADGNVTLDLTSLNDGALTTSVTATDINGNETTVAGPDLSLQTAPDTSADEDNNLSLSAPDTSIDALEVANVSFIVSGIDSDASAVVTVTDGNVSVTGNLASDGTVLIDLSSLADGALTSSVTASDLAGNTAIVAGPSLTLDTAPGSVPVTQGTSSNDRIVDGDGDSVILGLAGNDTLIGRGGSDAMFGGEGNDILRGDGGNDTLSGGAGTDFLRDSGGIDTFVFDLAGLDGTRDRVEGFDALDSIDLTEIVSAFGWTQTEAESYVNFTSHSKGVYVELSSPDVTQSLVDLRNVTLADIGLDNLVFF